MSTSRLLTPASRLFQTAAAAARDRTRFHTQPGRPASGEPRQRTESYREACGDPGGRSAGRWPLPCRVWWFGFRDVLLAQETPAAGRKRLKMESPGPARRRQQAEERLSGETKALRTPFRGGPLGLHPASHLHLQPWRLLLGPQPAGGGNEGERPRPGTRPVPPARRPPPLCSGASVGPTWW